MSLLAERQFVRLRRIPRPSGDIHLVVKRQRRKTIAIHVLSATEVEVRSPLRCSQASINEFVAEKLAWIDEAVARLHHQRVRSFGNGDMQPYLGREHRLVLLRGQPSWVAADAHSIVIRCVDPTRPDRVRAHLARWYAREADRHLPARLSALNELFDDELQPQGLRIRKMRARWGSCDVTGEICINSMLMQKPESAIDLVLAHELCHLRHFSHGRAFYGLLSRVMPDWCEREQLLDSSSIDST
ncbi:MAG: SprT family zinc-dependent metalloprotease [Proteobacteria bacterium]|jgi:predicted metal-dependent hydrolase|nr:SprT family zinc-dependent metalloprotease [Pseudomonadota bacterium]